MARRSFLWITDLHYEQPDTNYLDDPKEIKDAYNWGLRENVFTQLERVLEQGEFGGMNLSFIAIGGDVTTQGQLPGFSKFGKRIFPKLKKLVKPEAICIVPGNHDVLWGADPTSKGYFDKKFAAFREMAEDLKMTTCLFPKGELGEANGTPKALAFRLPKKRPVFLDKKQRVLVLNFNSALRCGELNRKMLLDVRGYAAKTAPRKISTRVEVKPAKREDPLKKYLIRDVSHVTQEQITKLQSHMDQVKKKLGDKWQSYLRVALMHHHVVHYPGQQTEHKGYEFMVDSPLVLEFLEGFDFDIVLTGHKHQAYQRVERFKERDMFIIGGPTIGGYTSEDRGFRLVEFESNQSLRRVEIKDIKIGFARGNAAEEIRHCKPIELVSKTPRKAVVERAASTEGYWYRELASITIITPDGDAQRIVECEDLTVTSSDCPRAKQHPLHLPSTSGYLDVFRAAGNGVKVKPVGALPEDHTAQSSDKIALTFNPKIQPGKPVSYYYRWWAVNSFALDTLQFDRKYGPGQEAMEYTHFVPRDPVEDLTVVVEFPQGFRPKGLPRLRIARVNPEHPDAVSKPDDDDPLVQATLTALNDSHALRYYESLNIAAARIKAPSKELSYGIEWDLADAPARSGGEHLDTIVQQMAKDRSACLKSLYRVLENSRKGLLCGWDRALEASLMTFIMVQKSTDGSVGMLQVVAAGRSPYPSEKGAMIEDLRVNAQLEYGLGVAGHAFKANGIRLYVAPVKSSAFRNSTDQSKIEPDYYVPITGGLGHKALMSFPLHRPVEDEVFQKNPRAYRDREPYGVINIGSESSECPVGDLTREERTQELIRFQHDINKIMDPGPAPG